MDIINIINLDKNIDRRNNIVEQLLNTNFKFRFFRAIENVDGWKGCLHSHLSIIETAKEQNLDYVIVCEDDMEILDVELFNKKMPIILEWLKNYLDKWQIYHDGYTINKASTITNSVKLADDSKLYYTNHVTCATFVIYNKCIYDQLLYYKSIHLGNLKNKHKIDAILNVYYTLLKPYPIMIRQKNNNMSDIYNRVRNDSEKLLKSSQRYFNINIRKYEMSKQLAK